MKCLFLVLYSVLIFCQLIAEEVLPLESSGDFSDWIELKLPDGIGLVTPSSVYIDAWDPKQKLSFMLPGIRVEEKNLIVDLDKAIKESREEQDLLRSKRSWFSDTSSGTISIGSYEEYYEEIDVDDDEELE